MPGQRPAHHADLALPGLVVDAGAPAGHLLRVSPGEHRDQRGRRGRVGDPHIPGQQAAVTRRDQVTGGFDAHLDGPLGLLAAHRRPGRHVRGAGPDLARQQPGPGGQVGRHPHVDHAHLRPGLGRDRVDDRAGGQEVGHHLRGDLLRPGRDALGVHAVVGGEHRDHGGLGQRRRALPGHPGQLHRHRFQPAERAARLGQRLLPLPGLGHGPGVQWPDRGERVGQQPGGRLAGQPAPPPLPVVHRPGQRPALGPAR